MIGTAIEALGVDSKSLTLTSKPSVVLSGAGDVPEKKKSYPAG